MRKIEYIFLVILLASFAFMLFTPNDATIFKLLLSVVVYSLGSIYFFLGWFIFNNKDNRTDNLLVSIVFGFVIAAILLGILFKVMIWPKGDLILSIYTVSLAILLFYIHKKLASSKENNTLKDFFKRLRFRSILFIVLGGFFLLIPTSSLINIYERDDPEYARLRIQAFYSPENDKYQKELDDYYEKRQMREFEEHSKSKL